MIARMLSLLALVLACVWPQPTQAENPIIQTSFTADPAPLVHKGVVYLYTGQDEDDARDFDPTVFVDDDGQAYMYWGNPNLYYVKLNPDMISYSGEIQQAEGKPRNYQEGPWFYKRQGKYYMAYASACCPEGIGYAMSDK